jgi:hypothetical protein
VSWQRDSDFEEETDYEVPEEPRRRVFLPIFLVIALVMTGTVSAIAWRAYGGQFFPPFAFGGGSDAPAAEPKAVGLDEFRAFQQQVAGQLQSNAQGLAAQQAELKRLSDQTAAVSAKMDALQSAISSARAAMPAPAPLKKSSPKPPARVSTGGAPLPLPAEPTH